MTEQPDLPAMLFSVTMFESGHVIIEGSTDLPPEELPVLLHDLADQLQSGAIVLLARSIVPFEPN